MSQSTVPGLSKSRLEALTDGIFATVMTVLVLSLTVPVITGPLSKSQLDSQVIAAVEALAPNALSYVLSFLLLVVLWTSHHNIFHHITRVDRSVLWLNALFLLTIGFIPFSTALIGRYPLVQVTVIIYGANIVGMSFAMLAIMSYASREKILVAVGEDAKIIKRIMTLWRTGPVIYLAAILISFLSVEASFTIYVVALAFYVLSSSLGVRRRSGR